MEERRKDYINLPVYAERWDNFMKMTEGYRQCLNAKIDRITNEIFTLKDSLVSLDKSMNEKILKLPCRERETIYKNLSNNIKIIWGILVLFIAALIVNFFK